MFAGIQFFMDAFSIETVAVGNKILSSTFKQWTVRQLDKPTYMHGSERNIDGVRPSEKGVGW